MALLTNKITTGVFLRDIISFIILYILGVFFVPRMLFLELLNGMLTTMSITIIVVYFADILERIKNSDFNGATVLRIGLILTWLVVGVQAFNRIYFIEFRPEVTGRTFDALVGAPAFVYLIAGAFHLIALGMIKNYYVRRNMCLTIWSGLAGALGVLIMKFIHV